MLHTPGLSRKGSALRAHKLMRFLQDGEGTGKRTSRLVKGLVMFLVSYLFLFQNKVLAQLDHSHAVIRLLEYRLNLMDMHHGFLWAGQHSDNFVCLNTSGIECPAVSFSCSGGIAGIKNRLCNSATLI
jgi:hypothetical protein